MANATAALLADPLAALDTGCAPESAAEDNRRSLALMLAAYRSQSTGKPVTLEYQ